MKREAAAAFISFGVTLGLAPLIRRFCQRTHILDEPGSLKIHAQPIPRLGGVAIFFGLLAGIAASDTHKFTAHWQFFAAIFVIWAAGLIDDLRGLSAGSRLSVQVLCALFLWQGGWHIPLAANAPTQIVLLCLFVILFANSFNFLDGSDGLATGVSCVIAVSYLAMPRTALTPLGFSAALGMAAVCVAFLLFNWHPASIFLGDSGSTLLGFLAAFVSLDFASKTGGGGDSLTLVFAIAALPIFDALRVIAKRIALHTSPTSGDRCHFYDALLASGWSTGSIAALSWTVVASCGAIAVTVVRMRASIAWSVVAFVLVATCIHLATTVRGKNSTAASGAAEKHSVCEVFVGAGNRAEPSPQEGKKL
ncbi:MAG: glycosyltransferase family 4 protein [Candidatus Acidiferrales bacterium]